MNCKKCGTKMVSSIKEGTATYECPECGHKETGWSPVRMGTK